jgi:hypothetical protein
MVLAMLSRGLKTSKGIRRPRVVVTNAAMQRKKICTTTTGRDSVSAVF